MASDGSDVAAVDNGHEEDGLVLRDMVHEPSDVLLAELYQRVLAPSFKVGELEPPEVIREQVDDGGIIRMLAYFDADSKPVAVITADWYPRSEVLLIGYLAVRPDLRRQGLGTRLIGRAASKWIAEERPVLTVAEVEDPRFYTASDTGDPVARLRMYERLGGRIVGVPYFQPQLSDDLERVHHLMLMAFGVNSERLTEDSPVRSVPTAPIGVFLGEYFEAAEGSQPLDEEFLKLKAEVLSAPEAPLLRSGEIGRLPSL
jgi:GNAT superfamily N-acetyltransferase